jgi:hypothetical protein
MQPQSQKYLLSGPLRKCWPTPTLEDLGLLQIGNSITWQGTYFHTRLLPFANPFPGHKILGTELIDERDSHLCEAA